MSPLSNPPAPDMKPSVKDDPIPSPAPNTLPRLSRTPPASPDTHKPPKTLNIIDGECIPRTSLALLIRPLVIPTTALTGSEILLVMPRARPAIKNPPISANHFDGEAIPNLSCTVALILSIISAIALTTSTPRSPITLAISIRPSAIVLTSCFMAASISGAAAWKIAMAICIPADIFAATIGIPSPKVLKKSKIA